MKRQKYKRVPYVHKSWPKMHFHPVCGSYVICQSEADIPAGFVENLSDCENPPTGVNGPMACLNPSAIPDKYLPKTAKTTKADTKTTTKIKGKPGPKKKTETVEKVEEKTSDGNEDPVTLESLELDRSGAMVLLDEAEIEYRGNISNEDLAALVADMLEED